MGKPIDFALILHRAGTTLGGYCYTLTALSGQAEADPADTAAKELKKDIVNAFH